MKHRLLIVLLIFPLIAWALFGLRVAASGFDTNEEIQRLQWTFCGGVLALTYLIGLAFVKTRRISAGGLCILAISIFLEFHLCANRLASEIKQLETIYKNIASRGPEFPQHIETNSLPKPAYLHWYYQKNPGNSFAIVYTVSSDSWAMEYPDGQWRWIDFSPDGYKPQ